MDGRYFVEGKQLRANGSDLIALTDEPVNAKVVLIGHAPVHFTETVPAVTVLGVVGVKVVRDADRILREYIRSPQSVQHALHGWVNRDALLGKDGLRLILPTYGRLCGCAGFADDKALMLKGEESEELVFEGGPTDGEASVVVANLLLGVGKRTLCSEELVAVEVVDRAVNLIGASAESDVDGAAGIASAFRAGLGLRGELVYGVEGKDDTGDTGDTPPG